MSKTINALTQDSAPATGDFVATWDTSASATKKVALSDLGAVAGAAWTSYSPTWSAASGSVSLGNGTLTGAYVQVGKTVHARINLTLGSTTSTGTSAQWRFTLPITAAAGLSTDTAIGSGNVVDSGGLQYPCTPVVVSATTLGLSLPKVSGAAVIFQTVDYNNPITFGSADYIRLSFTYEAA